MSQKHVMALEMWKLKDFTPGTGFAQGASARDFHPDESWIDITVPGDVYQALQTAGRIQDPFYGQNEQSCAWIREREWWVPHNVSLPTNRTLAG